MRLACPSLASKEAQSIVKRAFLRELPPDTPADLRDELQNGWLTIDGRPLSSEISAEDGRTTEATKRSVWWIVTAFAVGWAVAYLFTTAVPAAAAAGPDALPGDNVSCEVTLITPVALEKGLRFAIREGGHTVGAGAVTEIIE